MRYDWQTLYDSVKSCELCDLCKTRTNTVIGRGDPKSPIMLVGEGPGADEDIQGLPFVGRAGQLLDKILAAVNIDPESVYIANVVKCRPPNNRTPLDSEAIACLPYLRAQYALVAPKIIICLGATAAKHLINPEIRITRERGQWIEKKGVWMLATYHPAALLRDETKKRPVWEDFKSLLLKMDELNIKL